METAYNLSIVPDATQNSGAITVEILWDHKPDLDLHIFEPSTSNSSGFHIYYRNRTGISGYLDVDDTNGYGPEHYYTSC